MRPLDGRRAGEGVRRVLLHTNSTLLLGEPDWETHSRAPPVCDRGQAELEGRPGLFKGPKNAVQMLNFVVFHLFPVLGVPALDVRGTSGEPGEILGL